MIAVLQKVFTVLDVFARLGDPLSLSRLTQDTGMPKPTVYRIVQSMVELGYLAQDPVTGQYLRTSALEALGRNAAQTHLRQRLRPRLEELHRRFDETVSLATFSAGRVHHLVSLETGRRLRPMLPDHNGEPFHASAAGKAIAAFLPEQERHKLIATAELTPLTPQTVRTRRQLEQILDCVREEGWAAEHEECEPGIASLAVPVREAEHLLGAIAVTLPLSRLTDRLETELIAALKHAGESASLQPG